MRLTFDRESVEIQREVELELIQRLISPSQEAFKSTADVSQVSLGELQDETMQ